MDAPTTTLALFTTIGWPEIAIILCLGVLLFGRRLPDVGRNVARSIVEFKKGLKSVQDEIEEEARKPSRPPAIESEDRRVSQSGSTITMDEGEANRAAEPARD